MNQEQFHGSDLEKIEKTFGIPKEKITGFGANVNPLGLSPKMKAGLLDHLDAITTYPDPAYQKLRTHIASYTGCDAEQILPGNGCTELISLFSQALKPKKALIVTPTYSEYEREITLVHGEVLHYALQETLDFRLDIDAFTSALKDGIDLCVICNPNNPTSTALTPEEMRRIFTCCKEHHIFALIDETYAEFAPEEISVSSTGLLKEFDNFAILRGTSKFFAAPGLRLGYAMTSNTALLQTIRDTQNPWSVSTLADIAGSYMFTDTDYIEKTRHLIASERERIYKELLTWPQIKPYKPYANFILVRILRKDLTAHDIFLHAIKEGLMLRDCSTFPGLEDNSFFRFCFLTPDKNTRLLTSLKELLS